LRAYRDYLFLDIRERSDFFSIEKLNEFHVATEITGMNPKASCGVLYPAYEG
jgi:hypothetical protein